MHKVIRQAGLSLLELRHWLGRGDDTTKGRERRLGEGEAQDQLSASEDEADYCATGRAGCWTVASPSPRGSLAALTSLRRLSHSSACMSP